MQSLAQGFIDVWLWLVAGVFVFLLVYLIRHWKAWNWQKRLCTMAVMTLCLHCWEEWRIPGGFWWLYNAGVANYPMSELTDSITNFAGIVLGLIVILAGLVNNVSAFVIAFICLFEGLAHGVFLHAKSVALFSRAGDPTWYNPGFFTAIFLFVPIGIGLVLWFVFHHPTVRQVLLGIFFAAVVNIGEVIMPEALLKDPESPYAFTSRGMYYSSFKTVLPPADAGSAAGTPAAEDGS